MHKQHPSLVLALLALIFVSASPNAQTVRDQNDDMPGPPSDVSHRFDSSEPEEEFVVQDGIDVWKSTCSRSHEVIEASYELPNVAVEGDDVATAEAWAKVKAQAAARAIALSADAVIIHYISGSNESEKPGGMKVLSDSIKYTTP